MTDPYFFGYGSLVNRDTHSYTQAEPAVLSGWRRVWRQTSHRALAYLSAEPCAGSQIAGLIAAVPNADWAALDLRESGYERLRLSAGLSHATPPKPEVAIYSVPPDPDLPPTQRHPILQSYLDVVFLGYLREFGRDGLEQFVATTVGWDVPLLGDRENPQYPRAIAVNAAQRRMFDDITAALPLT